ncbi:phage minor head protein [Pedobacter immunditicola]|uniref:phage minor head protein n=1 Tax=Pedobacter immunditicola TaxID=3133440 RepID=UPI0030AAA494
MNVKRYYRAYNNLIKKYERLSYQVVLKGFKSIYSKASEQYLNKPDTPIELLVSEQDTLDILVKIYDGIGISMGLLVTNSLPKQKGKSLNIQTKADKKPKKQYIPTPDDHPDHTNFWKQEFIRFTQSTDCATKVKGITDTTRNQIRQVMNDAVKDQLSHKQIAKLLLDEADGITTKKRALLIARTENCVGSNLGAIYSAKSSGLVLYKQWIARSGDSRTRDSHAGMVDSAPIPIDDLFDVGDDKMSQPGDSSNGAKAKNICNCRCTVAFIPASEVIPVGLNPTPVKPARKPRTPKPKPTVQPELFDNIIQPVKTGFQPAKTIEEASQWAINNNMAKHVDYTWIKDVKVANDINRVLYNLKDRFNFDTLDQIGGKPKPVSALMSANYRGLNMKHSYWKTDKIIHQNYAKVNENGFRERALANAATCKRNYEISKNSKWLKQAKHYEDEAKFNRWTINYAEDRFLESTIHHEFGHVLHDQLIGGINGLRVINKTRLDINGYRQMATELDSEHYLLYGRAKQNGDIYKISAYGASNNKEFFAETFVMYMAKDPDLPIYIVEYFDKLFRMTKI